MTTASELRPADPADARVWDAASTVHDPVVCLLDGVPAANHPLLQGRVIVHDPDDLLSNATVDELKHGTWMASAAVWGDLGSNEPAARRPVLVRPILTPSDETADRSEELPATELVPDLMWRVFRELFEGKGTEAPAGSQIAVVNLSVGDPASSYVVASSICFALKDSTTTSSTAD